MYNNISIRCITNHCLSNINMFLGLLFIVFTPFSASSQQQFYISIDRNIYISGENIEANIGCLTDDINKAVYLYCDLLGQDGSFYSGHKYKLTSQTINIEFPLPENIKSGYYALRLYTYSMLLYPNEYKYVFFKVVNPQSKDILYSNINNALKIYRDTLCFTKNNKAVNISLNKKLYSTRELAELNIEIDSSIINCNTATIAIVPQNSFNNYSSTVEYNTDDRVFDNEGSLIMHGTLESKKTKVPIANQRLYISIVHSNDLMTAITDSMGRWALQLPDYYGNHEVIISPEENNPDFDIKIEKEFDFKNPIFISDKFILDSSEQKLALKLARNLYISKEFHQKRTYTEDSIKEQKAFYNYPDQVIRIMDYVDMPHLSMYFTELPGNVHLNKKKNKYFIRIINKYGIELLQKPLLLVDNVPVSDLEFILNMNPKLVNRIEIVYSDYQKGDASFGGIINFITNNHDFGGLSFPETSVSINYQFIENTKLSEIKETPLAHSPDSRNTLAFFSNLSFNNKLFFYTSDVIGNYQVIVQGFNKNGTRECFSFSFKVKSNK